jgi:hypothetical protein
MEFRLETNPGIQLEDHGFCGFFTRPGKPTKSYGKWPFIVSFPIEIGDFL